MSALSWCSELSTGDFSNLHEAGSPVDQSDVVDATGIMRLTQNNDWISEKPSRGGLSFLVIQLCGCPLLALSGHTELHCTCPLSGVKRTSRAWEAQHRLKAHAVPLQVQFLTGAFAGAVSTAFAWLFVPADVRFFFEALWACFA